MERVDELDAVFLEASLSELVLLLLRSVMS